MKTHVQHLNFCRQFKKQLGDRLQIPNTKEQDRASNRHLIDLCEASQKFMLPDGGHLLEDFELRALDETLPLRLPHQFVALEWTNKSTIGGKTSRSIAFVRERIDTNELVVTYVGFVNSNATWKAIDDISIPMTGYIVGTDHASGRPFLNFEFVEFPEREPGELQTLFVSVVLSFLNALACSNVRAEPSGPKTSKIKKIKTALPFDVYHVLTVAAKGHASTSHGINGDHRSPREHLRRGHIVRPEGRRPYWRNATVVNAGRGFSKVTKDYRMKSTSRASEGRAP